MAHTRVYPTVPSALLDDRSAERQAETSEFWQRAPSEYELCISALVLDEISRARQPRRDRLEDLVSGHFLLPVTHGAVRLAQTYVQRDIIPARYADDALHLAIATVHAVPILASWNFRHLVKLKTQHLVTQTNAELGFLNIDIVTPAQL